MTNRITNGVSGKLNRDTDLAWVAQMVERVLGKDEVTGSIPVPGSRIKIRRQRFVVQVCSGAGVTQR